MTVFGPDQLRQHVEAALATIPDGRTHALVAFATTDGSMRFDYVHRVNDSWVLGAYFERLRDEGKVDMNAGVFVKGSW